MGKKFCLTLDKNVLDFCKLNDIEDVREFAIKCFEKGLTIEKYGETPLLMPKEIQTVIKEVEKEVIKEVLRDRPSPPTRDCGSNTSPLEEPDKEVVFEADESA